MRAPEEAAAYLRELRALLESLEVSDVRMEEGSLRCDANVSVRSDGDRRARHQGRDQEHELGPVAGACARRSRSTARPRRSRPASRSSRRRGTGTRTRAPRRRCARRRRRSTTGTSRSPTSPRWSRTRRGSRRSARSLPELPRARRDRYADELGLKPEVARVLVADRAVDRPVRGDGRARRGAGRRRRTGSPRTWRACATRTAWPTRRRPTVRPRHIADLVALVADGHRVAERVRSRRSRRRSGPATPSPTSSRRRGLRQVSDAGELGAVVDAGARGEPGRRSRSSAPARRA